MVVVVVLEAMVLMVVLMVGEGVVVNKKTSLNISP